MQLKGQAPAQGCRAPCCRTKPAVPSLVARQRLHGIMHQRDIAAGVSSSASQAGDLISFYTAKSATPAAFSGPVGVAWAPGKGLALRATEDVAAGTLLLVSLPLAVVYGAQAGSKQVPPNTDLVAALASRPEWSAEERGWIEVLCARVAPDGDGAASPAPINSADSQALLRETLSTSAPLLAQARHLLGLPTALPPPALAPSSPPSDDSSAAEQPDATPTITGIVADGANRAGTSASAPIQTSPRHAWLEPQALELVVGQNCYSEAQEDIALAELRDDSPLAFGGLWPEFSLLNHSCAPNTAHVVVGGALALRAARAIERGEEVTTCYLGARRFAAVAQRRELLRRDFGFHCTCPRCRAEQEHFPTRRYAAATESVPPSTSAADADSTPVSTPTTSGTASSGEPRQAPQAASTSYAVLDAAAADKEASLALLGERGSGVMGRAVQGALNLVFGERYKLNVARDHLLLRSINAAVEGELSESVQSALTVLTRPKDAQQAVARRLQALIQAVEGESDYLRLPLRGRLLTQASVLGLYRLLLDLDEHAQVLDPAEHAALLSTCVRVVASVGAGTELHLFLAARAAARARGVHGSGSEEARAAELAAAQAHVVRYGPLGPELLGQLLRIRARLSSGKALSAQVSMLAWNFANYDPTDPSQQGF